MVLIPQPEPSFHGELMAPIPPDQLVGPRDIPTAEPGDIRITVPGPSPGHDEGCICVYCEPPSIQQVVCPHHGQVGLAHNTPMYAERVAWDHIRRAHHGRGGVNVETPELASS